MYILEDVNGNNKVIITKELALREAVKMVKECYEYSPNDAQELQDYRDIMEQYFNPTKTGFYIDDLFWVYEAEVIDK